MQSMLFRALALFPLLFTASTVSLAQPYPTIPVSVVVGFVPGGGSGRAAQRPLYYHARCVGLGSPTYAISKNWLCNLSH